MAGQVIIPSPRGPESATPPRSVAPDPGAGLFEDVFPQDSGRKRRSRLVAASVVFHAITITALVVVPILWPEALPETQDYLRVLIYDPPAAAAAPLPKGRALVEKAEKPKQVTPEANTKKTDFQVQLDKPEEKPIEPEQRTPDTEQFGSETGSDMGIPEGMEGGVEGGVAGGVPWGVVGGCVGCTGTGPVMDFDQGPRPISLPPPKYPNDAFIKKIEGVVELEILIDGTGTVIWSRVIRSIPALDQAARECVARWRFMPAMKHGRPVATTARAPVTFRIY